MPQSALARPRRRKVLYESQPSDDDAHTTDDFLEELVVNATVTRRSYPRVVWDSLPVNQQVSTVTLVATASFLLVQGHLTTEQLLCVQLLLLAVGALLFFICSATLRKRGQGMPCDQTQANSPRTVSPYCAATRACSSARRKLLRFASGSDSSNGTGLACSSSDSNNRAARCRAVLVSRLVSMLCTAVLFVGGIAALSPLYVTLAQSISTDSIVFLSTVLLTVHLFLWDYSFSGCISGHATSVSLGCAVLASILCASRGGSAAAAFTQVMLALEAYVIFPQLRHVLAQAFPTAHVLLTLGMAACAAALLWPHSVLLAAASVCSSAFVSLICPMWLVRVGKYKAQINGPWDEAVPRLSREVRLRVASPRKLLGHRISPPRVPFD